MVSRTDTLRWRKTLGACRKNKINKIDSQKISLTCVSGESMHTQEWYPATRLVRGLQVHNILGWKKNIYVELEMRMRGLQQFHWMAKGGFSMHGHLITSPTYPHQHAPSVEVTTIHPSALALPINVFLLESRFDWMGVETRTKLRHPIGCHGPDCTHKGWVLTLIEG